MRYNWNGKNKAITFSYDDGVTQDIRLIELLNKYNLKCTFNINSELLSKKISGSMYFETFEEIKKSLKNELRQGDLLMIMGAGDITKLANSI